MNFLMRILISTAAVLLTGWILPDSWVHVDGIFNALLVAVVLAFLNQVVKPILIVLTIPVTFATLGLFLLVINAGVILLADYIIKEGFEVGGFWSALGFSIVLSFITALLGGNRKGGNGTRFQRTNGGVHFEFRSNGSNDTTESDNKNDSDTNNDNQRRLN